MIARQVLTFRSSLLTLHMPCRIRQLEGRLLRSAMRMSPSASMRGSLRSSGSRSPSSSFSGGVHLHQQSHRLSLITILRAAALSEVPWEGCWALLAAIAWHDSKETVLHYAPASPDRVPNPVMGFSKLRVHSLSSAQP